jgi:hypothetical protein
MNSLSLLNLAGASFANQQRAWRGRPEISDRGTAVHNFGEGRIGVKLATRLIIEEGVGKAKPVTTRALRVAQVAVSHNAISQFPDSIFSFPYSSKEIPSFAGQGNFAAKSLDLLAD